MPHQVAMTTRLDGDDETVFAQILARNGRSLSLRRWFCLSPCCSGHDQGHKPLFAGAKEPHLQLAACWAVGNNVTEGAGVGNFATVNGNHDVIDGDTRLVRRTALLDTPRLGAARSNPAMSAGICSANIDDLDSAHIPHSTGLLRMRGPEQQQTEGSKEKPASETMERRALPQADGHSGTWQRVSGDECVPRAGSCIARIRGHYSPWDRRTKFCPSTATLFKIVNSSVDGSAASQAACTRVIAAIQAMPRLQC